MNFNLLILLFVLCSCGVKGDPSSPKDQHLPSVLENYDDINVKQPLKDAQKKN